MKIVRKKINADSNYRGTTDYEFYNISDELAKAIILILCECEK